MIEINVFEKVLDKAQKAADKLGVLNNSIAQGRGNKAGYVMIVTLLKIIPIIMIFILIQKITIN